MHSWLRLISAWLNLHISVILLKSCVYLCVLEIIVYLMLLISFTPSLSSWIEWLKWVWSKGAGQKGRGPRSIFSSLALSETLFTWPVFWPVPPPPPPPHTHSLIYLSLDTFRAFHPRVGLRKCKKKKHFYWGITHLELYHFTALQQSCINLLASALCCENIAERDAERLFWSKHCDQIK